MSPLTLSRSADMVLGSFKLKKNSYVKPKRLFWKKVRLLLSPVETGFFTKTMCYWREADRWACSHLFHCNKRREEATYLAIRSAQNSFSFFSGKLAMLVGVSPMQQNVWKPFKWLFDNLIKENALSCHTPPTADKRCHLPQQYFTKHFPVQSESSSSFEIRHRVSFLWALPTFENMGSAPCP